MSKPIRIIVEGGVVQDVLDLPAGVSYVIEDIDNCDSGDCKEPSCPRCKEKK